MAALTGPGRELAKVYLKIVLRTEMTMIAMTAIMTPQMIRHFFEHLWCFSAFLRCSTPASTSSSAAFTLASIRLIVSWFACTSSAIRPIMASTSATSRWIFWISSPSRSSTSSIS
eukprot:XP_001708356.1 Hypothetical protein GL50803_18856 [Giardia lamblia ATCC 50803]